MNNLWDSLSALITSLMVWFLGLLPDADLTFIASEVVPQWNNFKDKVGIVSYIIPVQFLFVALGVIVVVETGSAVFQLYDWIITRVRPK